MASTDKISTSQKIKQLEDYLSLHPTSTAFARLAQAHAQTGNHERALKILDKGLRQHIRYVPAHILKATTLLERKQPFKAEESLREALAIDPANTIALRMLCKLEAKREAAGRGVTARKLAALDPASQAAKQVLTEQTDVSSPFTTRSVAELYESQGYLTEALRIYHELKRRQPDNIELEAKITELERKIHGTKDS